VGVALLCSASSVAWTAGSDDVIELPPVQVHASYPLVPAGYRDTPLPPYPRTAREQGLEGLVVLGVRVDADGKVSDVQLRTSSGVIALDDAALDAVKAWTFVPARRGAQAVATWVEVPVRFALTRK
jgi:protein TonB